jgi:DNA modification methylase
MTIVKNDISQTIISYVSSRSVSPLFLLGNASRVLGNFPDSSIDFCMTSPPYWGQRKYHNGGIGLEADYEDYISNLITVFAQIHRVLKPTGSFWLNIGDSYLNKCLLGIPWRLAITLIDQQDWILRNSVIWNKIKGAPDNTQDRLRNVHENVFHFVKIPKDYYYDVDAIRSNPKKTKVVNGSIVSATGVSGVRYKRQIELSTALTEQEKHQALERLDVATLPILG